MNVKSAALVSAGFIFASGFHVMAAQGSGDNGFPAVRFVRWVEPKERAFTVEVPQGWSVEGGLNWLGPIDPQGFVRMVSPNGKIKVFLGDPELLAREVPTPLGKRQAGVDEGQTFQTQTGSPAKLERYMTGAEYAKEHVTWRLCAEPAWVKERDLPEASREMSAAVEPEARRFNVHAIADAGEVTYTCGTAQGATFATTLTLGHGGPIEIWAVYRVAGFQSNDPLHSMEARYIMEHLLASFTNDQAWQDALDRKAMQLTGAVMSMQNAALQSALAASRQQNETLARMNHPNAGVPSRSTSTSGGGSGSRTDVNTTMGTAHVCDAIGRCATVSNTADSYFMDHSGNVRSGSAGAPPDKTGVWSRLY